MQLSRAQRQAINASAAAKEWMRRHGRTPKGHRLWAPDEDEIVRRLYPDYRALELALPHRTRKALEMHVAWLGIAPPRRIWADWEVVFTKPRYRSGLPIAELVGGLTEKTPKQVWRKASSMGWRRPRRPPLPTGHTLFDAVRSRAHELNIALSELGESLGSRRALTGGRPPSLRRLARAVVLLDGALTTASTPPTIKPEPAPPSRAATAAPRRKPQRAKTNLAWTAAELQVLHENAHDYAALAEALPHRSYQAIKLKAIELGLRPKRHRWTGAEVRRVRELHARGASNAELCAAFPGLRFSQIKAQFSSNGLGRRPRPLKSVGVPLLDEIRRQAQSRGLSMVDLDREAKTGAYFQKASRYICWKHVERALKVLKLPPSAEWRE